MVTDTIQIIPASYNNSAKRIPIPDLILPDHLIPGSPEDISIPVPPSGRNSGAISPFTGIGTPAGASPRIAPMQAPAPSITVSGSALRNESISSPKPLPSGEKMDPQIALDPIGPSHAAIPPPATAKSTAAATGVPTELAERVQQPQNVDEVATAAAHQWEEELKGQQALDVPGIPAGAPTAGGESGVLPSVETVPPPEVVVKRGPGGGPGSMYSGGGPPGGSASPPQPLRMNDTHVDPKS